MNKRQIKKKASRLRRAYQAIVAMQEEGVIVRNQRGTLVTHPALRKLLKKFSQKTIYQASFMGELKKPRAQADMALASIDAPGILIKPSRYIDIE